MNGPTGLMIGAARGYIDSITSHSLISFITNIHDNNSFKLEDKLNFSFYEIE